MNQIHDFVFPKSTAWKSSDLHEIGILSSVILQLPASTNPFHYPCTGTC